MTGNLNILSTEKPSLVTVQDDFLEREYFDRIVNTVWQGNFPWGFQRDVARVGEHMEEGYGDHFYFVHNLWEHFSPESSFFDELRPVLKQLEVRALIRMRLLLFVNQGKQIIHDKHIELSRFALPAKVGVSDEAQAEAMTQLLASVGKKEQMLILLPQVGLKQIASYVQVQSVKRPTTVYERECAIFDGGNDAMMQRLADVRNSVLMTESEA